MHTACDHGEFQRDPRSHARSLFVCFFFSLLFGSSWHSVEGLTSTFICRGGAALITVGESTREGVPRHIFFTMARTHLVSTHNRSVSCTQLATKAGFDVLRDFAVEVSSFIILFFVIPWLFIVRRRRAQKQISRGAALTTTGESRCACGVADAFHGEERCVHFFFHEAPHLRSSIYLRPPQNKSFQGGNKALLSNLVNNPMP